MQFQEIIYEINDRVLTITLNRPDRLNAFTTVMADELVRAMRAGNDDDEVRAIVLTGAGRGFCAGFDLEAGGDAFVASDGERHRDEGGKVSLAIYDSLKPVIVAFNGPAVGIGVTMTLPADVRLASTSARFGLVFSRRGLVPEAASSWFLPRLVGISRALEWVSTGRVFTAEEAMQGGLVRSIYSEEELLPAAYELAHEIADHASPVSVALARQMMWRMLTAPEPMIAHEVESYLIQTRAVSADVREGIVSFLDKRPARFNDRVSVDMPEHFPWWTSRPFEPLVDRKS